MAQYTEYHPLKFWLDPASIAEIVAHIQTYLVNNPINSTTEIETIIHDYLIAHPELIGGVDSVNGQTGEVVLTADNISAGENVTIKDVLDSLQDQIDDIVASIPSDYQQLINDVSDLKSMINAQSDEIDSIKNLEPMQRTFVSGTAFGNTGSVLVTSDNEQRCRMWKNTLSDVSIIADDGYEIWVYFTNTSGVITDQSGVWVTAYEISADNTDDVTVVVKKSAGTVISAAEAEANVTFSFAIVKTITELQDDVISVDSRIYNLDGEYTINQDDFVIGAISITNNGWSAVSSTKRVSSDIAKPIHINAGDIIKLSDYSNARFYIGYRLSDGTYGTSGQWLQSDLVAPATADYVITISNTPEVVVSTKGELLDLLHVIDATSVSARVDAMSGGLYAVPGSFSATQVYTESYDVQKAVQGMCTDGTYLYQAVMEQLGNDGAGTTIKKIALSDFSLVSSNTGTWGHMNDMTYDGTYLLSIYKSSSNYNVISRFNPSTLEKVDDVDVSAIATEIGHNLTFIGIVYAQDIGRYILAVQSTYSLVGFAVLKSDWTMEKYIKVIPLDNVMQVIAYDHGIIYACIHRGGSPERIYAYDMHGNVINYTENSFGYEGEGIAIVDGNFYLSYNPSAYNALYIFKATPAFTGVSIAETMAKYNLNY